jgi:hypothetical protein
MKEDMSVVLWMTCGTAIHFDVVWDYRVVDNSIRFMFKDSAGRTMSADFVLGSVAGVALEQ